MTKKTAIIGKEKEQILGHTKGTTVKWRYGESRSFGNFYK